MVGGSTHLYGIQIFCNLWERSLLLKLRDLFSCEANAFSLLINHQEWPSYSPSTAKMSVFVKCLSGRHTHRVRQRWACLWSACTWTAWPRFCEVSMSVWSAPGRWKCARAVKEKYGANQRVLRLKSWLAFCGHELDFEVGWFRPH